MILAISCLVSANEHSLLLEYLLDLSVIQKYTANALHESLSELLVLISTCFQFGLKSKNRNLPIPRLYMTGIVCIGHLHGLVLIKRSDILSNNSVQFVRVIFRHGQLLRILLQRTIVI